jgi:diadenosine tetraphosphate (Ap4A) HIT family hydrolase
MDTLIHRRVAAARAGELPQVIARMASGWAVLGDAQFLPGYSLLLPDPVVPHLNALTGAARAQFLADMTTLGDAILAVTKAVRINYEMLGNLEPALHAHVFPRHDHEPPELRTKPVWFYDWQVAPQFDERRDRPLMNAIAAALRTS